MTDRLHKSGFKMHATLLRQIFQLIETGQVSKSRLVVIVGGGLRGWTLTKSPSFPLFMNTYIHTQVTAPLFDPATQPPGQTNQQYMREFVVDLLTRSFPNLTRNMIQTFVVGLFDPKMDLATDQTHLRDFLVQLKVSQKCIQRGPIPSLFSLLKEMSSVCAFLSCLVLGVFGGRQFRFIQWRSSNAESGKSVSKPSNGGLE